MKQELTSLGNRIRLFWFRPISAAGFGMMRVAFAATTFLTMIIQAPNVQRYYGPSGILPHSMISSVMRHEWRFSLLDNANASMVNVLFISLLITLVLVMLGIGGRLVLGLCLILLYSFHEYGSFLLDGGDTLTRVIGFLLLLAPSYRTCTLPNLLKRLQSVSETGKDQHIALRTMPIWPYRLLLWQMVCIYTFATYSKLTGPTWRSGSAIAIAIHHGHFQQVPTRVADWMSHFSPMLGYLTIMLQGSWALIIILPILSWFGFAYRGNRNLKRFLLLSGVILHTGILLMMNVGTFTYAVYTAYLGLLLDNDFKAIRSFINHGMRRPLIVLYDGRCGFCKKTIFLIHIMDWLHRIQFENLHDQKVRERYAPHVEVATLNEAIHTVDQKDGIKKGFFAVRTVCMELPMFWPVVYLLFIPGIPAIGTRVYGYIAAHRPIVTD